jgi:hypothetical protein
MWFVDVVFFETNRCCGSVLCLDQPSTKDWENWHKIIIVTPIPYIIHLNLSEDLGEVPHVSVRPRTRSQNSVFIGLVFDSFEALKPAGPKDPKRLWESLIGTFLNGTLQNPSQSSHATA